MTVAVHSDTTYEKPFCLFSLEGLVLLLMVLVSTGSVEALISGVASDRDSIAGTVLSAVRGQTEDFSGLRAALMIPLYLYSFYYLYIRHGAALTVARLLLPATILTFLTLLSTAWSLDPDVTLRRSVNVVGSTLIGFYLILRLTPRQFCRFIGQSFLAIGFLTAFAALFMPQTGLHHDQHYPALRGFFAHKNAMGNVMAIGLALGLALARDEENKRLGLMLTVLSAALVVLSLSRTAWVNGGFIVAAYAMVGMVRAFKGAGSFLSSLLLCAFGVLFLFSSIDGMVNAMATSMGRSETFSGRTEIWTHVWNVLTNGPLWFGFGYEAFWTSFRGAMSLDWGMSGYIPYHAHNGWLQMMTHLGLLGTALMTWALASGLWRSYRAATQSDKAMLSYAFLYIVYYVFSNLAEAHFLIRDQFFWILFLYAALDPSWRVRYLETRQRRAND